MTYFEQIMHYKQRQLINYLTFRIAYDMHQHDIFNKCILIYVHEQLHFSAIKCGILKKQKNGT